METLREYYTYAYLREDRTPYYIGKGKGDRVYKKRKGEIKLPKDKSRIIFLKKNLTEAQAFKHEIYMIAVLGRMELGTGILRNMTDGGEGSSGAVRSEEYRRKKSELMKGRYIGKNNPMYGKSHSDEMRKNVSGKNNPSYGKKWWNDVCGNSILSVKCPGEGWVLGMSENVGEKISKAFTGENNPAYGKKWWNDGFGNVKFAGECPGEGWVLGRGTVPKKSKVLA